MNEIKISRERKIAEECNCDGVIIYGWHRDGSQHVTTFGRTINDSRAMANIGNHMKKELKWDDALCHAEPTEHICGNCSYFKSKRDFYNDFRLEGGLCFYEIDKKERGYDWRACHNFEGK